MKRDWLIRLVAVATFLSGLVGVLQAFFVRLPEPRLEDAVLPFDTHHWSKLVTLATGFLLLALAWQLYRRRRVAWWAGLIVAVIGTAAHLGRSHHVILGIAPAVTAVLLVVTHRRFTVRSEPRGIRFGLVVLTASLAAAILYGTLGFFLLDPRDFGINFHWTEALVRTLREYTLFGNPDITAHTRQGRWFLDSLRLTGILAASMAAVSLFRPLAFRLSTLPHERAEAQKLIEQFGRSSIDWFKLWGDKSYHFTPDRRCFIAYRAAFGFAVALGDPVGPPERIEAAVADFGARCADNAWRMAFHQVLPDFLPVYARLGFGDLKIGEEAIVDLERFAKCTLDTSGFRRIRNRAKTLGLTVTRHDPPNRDRLLQEVEEISREWLTIPGRRERSFSLGSFRHDYVERTPLFVLRDESGRALAFLNLIPSYPKGNTTVDLMRHRVEVPNVSMDFLFMETMRGLNGEFQRFSLGLAPLSGVGDRPGAPIEERAIHQVYERLNRLFSYKGLKKYKAKFEPAWEERFLVYQGGPAGLVGAAIALSRMVEA